MANASTTGFGCRPAMRLGNTNSIQGQSKYLVESALDMAIYQNNPVSLNDGGATAAETGFLQDASYATTDDGGAGGSTYANNANAKLLGVFNGAFYVANTTKKPTWANSVAASTTFATNPNTGSTNGFGFVNDDPFQQYMMKTNAASPFTAASAVNQSPYNIASFTAGNDKDGQSTALLDITTGAAATYMFDVIRSAEDPENEDMSAVGGNVIVVITGASNKYVSG